MFSLIPDPSVPTTLPADAAAVSDAATERVGEGVTSIRDNVIAKVAGLAVREVPGVHALGTVPTRTIRAILDAISSTDASQGISVTVAEDGVAVEVVLVATYPAPLAALAEQVRTAVTLAVEGLVGMSVSAVDVTITDIHVAEDADDTDVV